MPKVQNQLWIYSITFFADLDKKNKVQSWMRQHAKKYMFQLEKCPTTGNTHFQCYVNLKEKQRVPTLIKSLNANGLSGATVLAASDAGKEALKDYCMKDDTRVAGPWADHPIYLGQDLPASLRPWQQEIVDLIGQDPDPRKIYWYYDEVGGAGKSILSKYLYFKYQIITLTIGKASDILNLVYKMQGRSCYIFDISRTVTAGVMTEVYAAMESVKNGYFVNTKYDTGVACFDRPHVIVFSNMLPKIKALSADRWVIKDLSQMSQGN